MAKKKLKSIAKVSQQAAELLQLLARLKTADENGYCSCVTCGVTRHYKDRMQGGHFISRVRTATRLLEENIHPQCAYCNGPLKSNPVAYTLFMIDTYDREFVDELEILKHQTKKWSRFDLECEISVLRERIKEQEARVVGVAA
ncbi:MAG: recombination protein NinG [Pseudomonadales bacterium]